jgi:hypothetical protein
VLDRSIGIALGGSAPSREATASAAPRIVDSPDFRLSRLDEGPLGLANPILVGDRIEISGRDGHRRSLEVTDIRELDSGFTHSENGASPRLLLVTCREVGGSGARVRFIVEAEELTPPVRRPERTL